MSKFSRWLSISTFSGTLGAVIVACTSSGTIPVSTPPDFIPSTGDGSTEGDAERGNDGAVSNDASDAGLDGNTCAATTQTAEVAPLDLLLLVDSSGSMAANGKWSSIAKAIPAFLNDPRMDGVGVGLQYFPLFAGAYPVCDDNAYALPEIPILPLDPTQAGVISTSLSNRPTLGGTPMGPALQGALRFALNWKKQNLTHKVVTVLATDGLPDDSCQFAPPNRAPNTVSGTQAEAAAALAATPSVPTYVIGVGTELSALNAVAASGGTSAAILVDVQKDVAAQLADAFDKIRRTELTCEYTLPPPNPASPLDLNKVNIRFTDALGYVDFVYVSSPVDCGKTDYGWYYDDPANPTRIVLCEPFCSEVKASRLGKVELLLGCARDELKVK